MKYERKDIKENPVVIVIRLDESYGTYISCRIYQKEIKKNFFGRLKNKIVLKYDSTVNLDTETSKWTCSEFEAFANRTLEKYNHSIVYADNVARTKDLIKNGCK